MSFIQITYEGKQSLKDIQDRFRKELSEKEILKATARALNNTALRVQGHIRAQIKKEYTINNKYLKRASDIGKKAYANTSGLYANVRFSGAPIPMIGFAHTGEKGTKEPISVTIKKGQTKVFKHAFIKTFKSGHTGIIGIGRYEKGNFVHERQLTSKGKIRMTELKAPSPFGMAFCEKIQPRIIEYVDKYLPGRVKYYLERQLSKMKQFR